MAGKILRLMTTSPVIFSGDLLLRAFCSGSTVAHQPWACSFAAAEGIKLEHIVIMVLGSWPAYSAGFPTRIALNGLASTSFAADARAAQPVREVAPYCRHVESACCNFGEDGDAG